MMIRLLILSLMLALTALEAAGLRCVECKREISGRYFTANGKAYCSEACIQKTWPKCSLCGKPFRSGVQMSEDPAKVFCAECAAKPQCFSCQLPADCRKLDDGREICPQCFSRAIFELGTAREIFDEVRRRLRDELKLGTDRKIYFQLTSLPELEKRSKESGVNQGIELGLFYHNFTEVTRTTTFALPWKKPKTEIIRTNERFAIYVLYGLPKEKLIEVCAHELAHDWMQDNYPGIKDMKIREGWAEYVATKANRLFGNENLNRRIERNPDPVYGDGYRAIAQYVADHGENGLYKYFGSFNPSRDKVSQ